MDHRLIQSQSQKLVLSPQIRQYLRLLQLPIDELEQAVEAEMTENPVLEEKRAEPAEGEAQVKKRENEATEVKPGENFEAFDKMDENFKESFQYTDFAREDRTDQEERRNFQESLITRPEVLSDFLTWQCRFLDFTPFEKTIAQQIVGNIDEDGYLRMSVEEIAVGCQCLPEEVLNVLQKIQELDPPGIAARNLQEALQIQLKKKIKDRENIRPVMGKICLDIVEKHLPLLEKRDYSALTKVLSHDMETIQKAIEIIAKLDPRPGRSFYADDAIAVSPDAAIVIDEDLDGQYKVELFDERIPEIRISPYYRNLLRDKDTDEKSKIFLKEKIQNALNFLQAMQMRKSTLRGITEAIVVAQQEFLQKGFLHLKPLRLKDIANVIGIHESTVSRAIQGKYVSTPQGTIPYKSFFSTRMETTEGPAESQKSIMEKIKRLVEKEPPKKPLSDQDIVKLMTEDGIGIARRTVAKYRDILKILPSHMRRRK